MLRKGCSFVKREETRQKPEYNQRCQPLRKVVHLYLHKKNRRRLADEVYHKMDQLVKGMWEYGARPSGSWADNLGRDGDSRREQWWLDNKFSGGHRS